MRDRRRDLAECPTPDDLDRAVMVPSDEALDMGMAGENRFQISAVQAHDVHLCVYHVDNLLYCEEH